MFVYSIGGGRGWGRVGRGWGGVTVIQRVKWRGGGGGGRFGNARHLGVKRERECVCVFDN